jgi:hypothetical protein
MDFVANKDGSTDLFYNDAKIGTMQSKDFQRALFDIYLGETAKASEVRDTFYDQVKTKKYISK